VDQLPLIQGGALAVITTYAGWTLFAILTGRLIPRSWVEAMRTQDAVLVEDLRARLSDANDTVKTVTEQRDLLIAEQGRTVTKVLRSLPHVPDEESTA